MPTKRRKEEYMHCVKKITDDLYWVGGNDRRLAMFEGVYSVPDGVSYNSYLLLDEKTVLFDTVDKAVGKVFFENVEHVLNGRKLDYVVIQHMEPDHSATLKELTLRYPEVKVVCNAKTSAMTDNFFDSAFDKYLVDEKTEFCTGKHCFCFVMAPMVHWPEVMVTYDKTDKILFSADAFGCFGALNGAMFADEVDFDRDYLDEARRYYCNIVGKYGAQTMALLNKAAALEINVICPLHGFVWRKNIAYYIDKYVKWATYTPEEQGVAIAYASVYGNTENAAEIASSMLRDRGIKTVMFDVSVTPSSEIVAAAFKYSHLLFASTTYNAGIFVTMDQVLREIKEHNLQKRTVAIIQNGSWAPTSASLMKNILSGCRDMDFVEPTVTIASSLKETQLSQLTALVDALAATFKVKPHATDDNAVLTKVPYGLYVLTAKQGDKDNGCIINTVMQVTNNPNRISVCVNKNNFTAGMVLATKKFNVSILTTDAPFKVFERFGFSSGRDKNKFEGCAQQKRTSNGLLYIPKYTNGVLSCDVTEVVDFGTHYLFAGEVTETMWLNSDLSLTYDYYFKNIKPQPKPTENNSKKVWVCKICGYVYDEEKGDPANGIPAGTKFKDLPADWVCPLCKHPKSDFEFRG